MKVLKYFPSLTDLKVCYNSITEINEINENISKKLKVLDLESNSLLNWENLLKLGELEE
jgi:Leucine-rich repeat (LRR) protein